jgi:predicted GIY-YIG superfamily endonuclease
MAHFFAYILKCVDGNRYYGHTANLRQRLAEHESGRVRSTASRRPVRFLWFHLYATRAEARIRERMLKNGRTRRKTIDAMVASFPKTALNAFTKGDPHRVRPDADL